VSARKPTRELKNGMNYSTSVWFSRRGGLLFVLLLYAAATLPALTRYPAPWVDEGWIGEVAARIASGHAPGNPSHGTLHRFNDRIYWMPPLYFYLLGSWFSLTGVTLLAGRLFNVLAGALTVVLLHRHVNRRHGTVAALLSCGVFALDTFAWKAHRTIRFESVIALLAVALFTLLPERSSPASSRGEIPGIVPPAPGSSSPRMGSSLRWLAVGLLAGLITNVHPLGALFAAAAAIEILRRHGVGILRTSAPYLAIAAFVAALLPYALYCYGDRSAGFANVIGQNSYHVDLGRGQGPVWFREWRRYAAFFPAPWRLPAAALGLAIVAIAWTRRREGYGGPAFTFLAVPLLGMAFLPNKTLLYLVPVLPFVGVLAGAVWATGGRAARAAVLLLVLSNTAVDAGLLWKNRSCDPVRSLAGIRSLLGPGDRVAGTFVTWWAAEPRVFHEFSRGATLEAVEAFHPDVIVIGDRQWEQEKVGRFGPLDRALHEKFAALGLHPTVISDPCLGHVEVYRLGPRLEDAR
jgi:4-amino-4-deoxy-L-arabinose transferase-like glycosyltransferase